MLVDCGSPVTAAYNEPQRALSARNMAWPEKGITMVTVAEELHNGDGAAHLRDMLQGRMAQLQTHRYFALCRTGGMTRAEMLHVIQQLYCFSVFYERLLTRRLSHFDSQADPAIVSLARQHLKEEIGHAELFYHCLQSNGFTAEQIQTINPMTFTRAVFGYLLTTIEYENEYIANIALIQVMETIAMHFFGATLTAIRRLGLAEGPFLIHNEADDGHAELGLAVCASLTPVAMQAGARVIDDLFVLMGCVLNEWLAPVKSTAV